MLKDQQSSEPVSRSNVYFWEKTYLVKKKKIKKVLYVAAKSI